MPQTATVQNPFLLMISPEVVLEAMERSERLSALNRHLCRPLDRPLPADRKGEDSPADEGGDEEA